jgi:uncharacterized membrane protein
VWRRKTAARRNDIMVYAVSYLAILITMAAVDAVWLTSMANVLYRPTLGDIMLSNLRVGPAIAFYLIYPVGSSDVCG